MRLKDLEARVQKRALVDYGIAIDSPFDDWSLVPQLVDNEFWYHLIIPLRGVEATLELYLNAYSYEIYKVLITHTNNITDDITKGRGSEWLVSKENNIVSKKRRAKDKLAKCNGELN